MIRLRSATLLALSALVIQSTAVLAGSHLWKIAELFSNDDELPCDANQAC
ncbi:MAG: hypothetical protein AAF517_11115 [Planctomycetota bacterium]